MDRRNFFRNTALGSVALTGLASPLTSFASDNASSNSAQFKLKYAPGFGMFREHAGNDPIDHIKFVHDQGFRAVFDNGFMGKEPALQEKIANELARRNMDMGPFVLYADFGVKSMVTREPEMMEMLKKKMHEAVELRKRTQIKQALVVPGRYDEKLAWDYQTANVIDAMRMCCDIVGPSGLELVMEPLNAHTDHPGLFLTTIPQSFMICKAVNHPSCKIVNDMYHQQITEGNIIPNMNMAWEYIGAFHIGDNPGRNEPTTGEINYLNIFKHIHSKGYDGVLCMEHGKSIRGKEGEAALIEAYRKVDAF
ncbi:hydroxypyruvate isomerase [Bacteroidales bacterium 6E]|nr:hydroxypyruvate isomerase [Bacteroidales bacterium 6E]